jgi:hypothetical protein
MLVAWWYLVRERPEAVATHDTLVNTVDVEDTEILDPSVSGPLRTGPRKRELAAEARC